MANYTGILGDKDARLGSVELGEVSKPSFGTAVTQEVAEVIYAGVPTVEVTQIIVDLLYNPNPNLVISQEVVEILAARAQSLVLSQQVVELAYNSVPITLITQEVVEVAYKANPLLIASQEVIEVLANLNRIAQVTQNVIEVIYQINPTNSHYLTQNINAVQTIQHSSLINRTIVTPVIVKQSIGGGTYNQTITTHVNVGQTVGTRKNVTHVSLINNVNVSQTTLGFKTEVYDKSISHGINVNQLIVTRNTVNRQLVNSTGTVNQSILPDSGIVNLSVTSNVSVDQIIQGSTREVSIGVTTNVQVNQSIAERNTVVRIEVISTVGASQSTGGRDTNVRQDIESDLTVTSIVVVSNSVVSESIVDTVTLIDQINARNTILRRSLISNIDVVQTVFQSHTIFSIIHNVDVSQNIYFQSQDVSMSVTNNVNVTQNFHINPISLNVTSPVTVYGSLYPANISFYVSPVSLLVFSFITVSNAIGGGSSNRQINVTTPINVSQSIRTNRPYNSVVSPVQIKQSIIFGLEQRLISIADTVTVTDQIDFRINPVKLVVQSKVSVASIIETADQSILDNIFVSSIISSRIIPYTSIRDIVHVTPSIVYSVDNNRQSVTSNVNVNQNFRYSPVHLFLSDNLHVATKLRRGPFVLTDKVSVSQQIRIVRERVLVQKPIVTDSVIASRDINRSVMTKVNVQQLATAGHVYIRNIIDYLPIQDQFIKKSVDFHNSPIIIPVAIGVIVNANQMILQSIKSQITLPPALLGDTIQNIGKVEIKKAMDGTARSYIQGTNRKKLTYKWKLSHLKAYELRQFIANNMSELIKITDWNGTIYQAKITLNPFELSNSGVYAQDGEFAEVNMEFEGIKIS